MSKRLDKLNKQLESISSEIQDLETFRNTKAVRKFRRMLEGERSHVKELIKKLTETNEERDLKRLKLIDTANRNRSSKNKRVWNYVKSIQKNYKPDLTLKDIRSQLKKHRQGLESDIPDVAWRNPSP